MQVLLLYRPTYKDLLILYGYITSKDLKNPQVNIGNHYYLWYSDYNKRGDINENKNL